MQRTETSIEAIRRLTPLDSFTDAQKLAAFAALSEDAQRLMLIGYAVPEWVVWDDLNERQRLAVHLRFVRRLTLDQAAQLMSEHFKSPITSIAMPMRWPTSNARSDTGLPLKISAK